MISNHNVFIMYNYNFYWENFKEIENDYIFSYGQNEYFGFYSYEKKYLKKYIALFINIMILK